MRDLLPGTWNGRTIPSGGGYYNASRVGGKGLEKFEHAHPNIYHVKLDSNPLRDEGDYVLKSPQRIKLRQSTPRAVSDFPTMLQPPGSDDETCFTLIEPQRVNLQRWDGVPRGENARVYVPTQANFMVADVPGIVDKFDIIAGSQTTTPGQLPEAWPSSWTFTEASDRSPPVRGYSPSRPSAPNGALTREVTAHPLMGALFSSVKRDDHLQVETVTTHVARSRGITLRYRTTHDGKTIDVAYANSFTTDGLVFTLHEAMLESSVNLLNAPFDQDSIKVFEHHLQCHADLRDVLNGFTVQHVMKALILAFVQDGQLQHRHTIAEALDWLKTAELSRDIIEAYVATVAESMRDFYRDDLETRRGRYNTVREHIWTIEEFGKSHEEWVRLTMLNTLAIGLAGAASSFTGVEQERIGTAVNIDEGTITLFDDDARGNGTVASIARHMWINTAARSARGAMRAPPIPSTDFVREFERWAVTCAEHLVHRTAMNQHADRPTGAGPYMNAIKHKADQQLRFRASVWEELDVSDLRTAGVYRYVSGGLLENANVVSVTEIDQALELCTTGCERCLGNIFSSVFPPSGLAERYASRALFDRQLMLGSDVVGYRWSDENFEVAERQEARERFEHWYPNKRQAFTYHDHILPQTIGTMAKRTDGNEPVEVKRLLRVRDFLDR